MTWAKIDDSMFDRPSMLTLDRGIRLVHMEALAWCCKHLTDGLVPRHALRRLTDEPDIDAAAAALVAVGVWREVDAGWELVDFHDDQLSADEVRDRQERARLRQERRRKHVDGDHSLCLSRYCKGASRVTDGVTNERDQRRDSSRDEREDNAVVTPPRPDPSRPDPVGKRVGEDGEGEGQDRPPQPPAAAPQGEPVEIVEPDPSNVVHLNPRAAGTNPRAVAAELEAEQREHDRTNAARSFGMRLRHAMDVTVEDEAIEAIRARYPEDQAELAEVAHLGWLEATGADT